MVDKIMKLIKTNLYLLISPIAAMCIILLTYYIHGVYPFGDKSISYYDMAQSYIPLYYRTWDILHGMKNLFFEWNVGMGCQMSDVVGPFVFFPTNLFFLFVNRNDILFSMSFFLILKVMLSAFSASFYFSKKTNFKALCVYTGVAYAFCGYVLQYYTNIYYLDVVIVFPVLVLSLERLVNEEKKYMYIFSLFLCFLANQQLTFTIIIYIVIKGWLVIRKIEVERRGKATALLVVSSIVSTMLGAFIFIPSFIVTSLSSRFGNAMSGGILSAYSTITCDFQNNKSFMFYGGEIAIGLIIYLVLFRRDTIKKYSDNLVMILLLSLPVAFENINLLWHGGSYQHFPMRFGYMLSFELIGFVASFLGGYVQKNDNIAIGQKILLVLGLIVLGGVLFSQCNKFRIHGIRDLSSYDGYIICIFIISALVAWLMIIDAPQITIRMLLVIAFLQAVFGAYGLIAPEKIYSMECDDQFVRIAERVYENIDADIEVRRIKDRNIDLNSNYGFIVNQSSLGGWMNGINPNVQSALLRMGYSAIYTKSSDVGGTVLTDALLGVNRIYSRSDADEYLYSNKKTVGEGYIYDCNYTMPFGAVLSMEPEGTGFAYQNNLFKSLTGQDGLFAEINLSSNSEREIFDEENGIYVFDCKISVSDENVLYLYGDRDKNIVNQYSFVINDKQVHLDAEGSSGNVMYAKTYLNGFLELGTYANETIDLKIITVQDTLDNLHIGLMNLNIFEQGIANINNRTKSNVRVEKNELRMDFETSEGGMLVLPIGYSRGYTIVVDNVAMAYEAILDDAFVGINIDKGRHSINMKYSTEGLGEGIVISVVGVLLGTMLLFWKKGKMSSPINKLWMNAYNIVFATVVIGLYLLPVVVATIIFLKELFNNSII